jgi:hypothetical protein
MGHARNAATYGPGMPARGHACHVLILFLLAVRPCFTCQYTGLKDLITLQIFCSGVRTGSSMSMDEPDMMDGRPANTPAGPPAASLPAATAAAAATAARPALDVVLVMASASAAVAAVSPAVAAASTAGGAAWGAALWCLRFLKSSSWKFCHPRNANGQALLCKCMCLCVCLCRQGVAGVPIAQHRNMHTRNCDG